LDRDRVDGLPSAPTSHLSGRATRFHTAIIVVTHDEKIIPTFKCLYHIRDSSNHEEASEGRSL
jgi:putative ABC transport system ATP-binding protein